jgi:hypothetical protein
MFLERPAAGTCRDLSMTSGSSMRRFPVNRLVSGSGRAGRGSGSGRTDASGTDPTGETPPGNAEPPRLDGGEERSGMIRWWRRAQQLCHWVGWHVRDCHRAVGADLHGGRAAPPGARAPLAPARGTVDVARRARGFPGEAPRGSTAAAAAADDAFRSGGGPCLHGIDLSRGGAQHYPRIGCSVPARPGYPRSGYPGRGTALTRTPASAPRVELAWGAARRAIARRRPARRRPARWSAPRAPDSGRASPAGGDGLPASPIS